MSTENMSSEKETAAAIRESTPHNSRCIGVFELVYTFGIAFYLPFTTVPAYLLHLQAPKTVIQVVMTLLTVLTALQIWGSRINHHPLRKQRLVLLWSCNAVPWLLFAICAILLAGRLQPLIIGTVFVACALIGVTCSQLAAPGYSEMIFQNIDPGRRGRFGAVLNISIGLGGFCGAWVTGRVMSVAVTPRNYHLAFIIGALLVICSSLALRRMHDHHARKYTAHEKQARILPQVLVLWRNFNFRVFLLFYALMAGSFALAPLFISCAADQLGTEQTGANVFSTAYYTGIILFGSSVPLLADRFGFRIIGIMQTLMMIVAFLLPLLLPAGLFGFYISYALFAGAAVLSFTVLANLGHEMVPEVPPALIIAISSALIIPVTMSIGPLAGLLVDLYGNGGYLAVFIAGLLLNSIAALGLLLIVREPRSGEELYIRIRRI